jgi:hypothetical protein
MRKGFASLLMLFLIFDSSDTSPVVEAFTTPPKVNAAPVAAAPRKNARRFHFSLICLLIYP